MRISFENFHMHFIMVSDKNNTEYFDRAELIEKFGVGKIRYFDILSVMVFAQFPSTCIHTRFD